MSTRFFFVTVLPDHITWRGSDGSSGSDPIGEGRSAAEQLGATLFSFGNATYQIRWEI